MLRREFLRCTMSLTLLACCLAVGWAEEKGPVNGEKKAGPPPLWPPYEKVESQLQNWHQKHAAVMKLDVVAKTAQGRAVYAARLTDPAVDDTDKEHVLVTTLHSGIERSGTTAVLRIMQWLLSQDRLAQ